MTIPGCAAYCSFPNTCRTPAIRKEGITLDAVTLPRNEWNAVARELEATYTDTAPAGLRDRILELLQRVPAEWEHEDCTLEMDAAAAQVVRAIVRQGRGLAENPALERSQQQSIAEAEEIVRDHQRRPDGP